LRLEVENVVKPGSALTVEQGRRNRFWNAGQEDLRCSCYIQPADNVEYFLTAIYASQRESGGRPAARQVRQVRGRASAARAVT
jgi:hypothetical protein